MKNDPDGQKRPGEYIGNRVVSRLWKWGKRGFCTGFFVLICVMSWSAAEGVENRISDLNVMTENYPPYNFVKNGELTGPCVDIVMEILKRTGHPPEIKVLPWGRAYRYILEMDSQVLFSMSRTQQREDLFKWVGPLVDYNVYFYARKGAGLAIDSLDDAAKVDAIGTGINTSGSIFLRELGFDNLEPVSKTELNALKLIRGRISLWLAGELTARYRAGLKGLDFDLFQPVYKIRTESLYIAFSKSTPDSVIDRWQQTLDAIKQDGTHERIFQRYSHRIPDSQQ